MKQTIHYRVIPVGANNIQSYLASIRGEKFEGRDNVVVGCHKFLCTLDWPNGESQYAPLEWREFNCGYIVTILNAPMVIEVKDK